MKTGRPHKAESEKKEIVKHIRYSPDEWARVEEKLQESGLTYTQFMRQAAQRAEVIKYNMTDYVAIRDARLELKRIGININNIARHGAMVTDSETLDTFMHDLLNCRDYAKSLYERLKEIENKLNIYDF